VYLVIGIALFALVSRVMWYLRMRTWVRSVKDPQKRMEADILYRSWRRSRRK
jgi:hypothetical protein